MAFLSVAVALLTVGGILRTAASQSAPAATTPNITIPSEAEIRIGQWAPKTMSHYIGEDVTLACVYSVPLTRKDPDDSNKMKTDKVTDLMDSQLQWIKFQPDQRKNLQNPELEDCVFRLDQSLDKSCKSNNATGPSFFTLTKSDGWDTKNASYPSRSLTLTLFSVSLDDDRVYNCTAGVDRSKYGTVILRVRDKLAALWPFLGFVVEVVIMCSILFLYEKLRSPILAREAAAVEQAQAEMPLVQNLT
ncbi:hypothetical protein BV898_04324 [Hypsibius exemplaris]|uniref:Immunoglobulin domain-containing protein n=1 Tax=Hypsibius exemplaris TaxID=2072580 RepID=A0A1W0X2M6_HYPEX|nr:hypothetical protein BV898_04324 [Hypsibius exemplaris]